MKKIGKIALLSGLIFLVFQSCNSRKVIVNREVDSKNDGKMLLGTQTLDQFQKEPYDSWYKPEYDGYAFDADAIAELKKQKINTYSITVFLGTWCPDSHREFPRFIKILEDLKYPMNKLTIIAVNRKKEAPNGEEGKYNIQKVPTFIISKYGKEVGRIIESPKSGWLERDLLEILKKDDTSLKGLFKK
jgi:thiol-disulfide isomerase/thioredoxin